MNNECRLQENLAKSKDTFSKRINDINASMDGETSNFTGEIEKIVNQFKSDLQEKTKSYIEQQNKVFERFSNEEDVGDEFDMSAQAFIQNPDLISQVFEQLKESFDNKVQEKGGKILKDRKDHWEQIDREINDSQHERNRNVILEILQQVKDFQEQIRNP